MTVRAVHSVGPVFGRLSTTRSTVLSLPSAGSAGDRIDTVVLASVASKATHQLFGLQASALWTAAVVRLGGHADQGAELLAAS